MFGKATCTNSTTTEGNYIYISNNYWSCLCSVGEGNDGKTEAGIYINKMMNELECKYMPIEQCGLAFLFLGSSHILANHPTFKTNPLEAWCSSWMVGKVVHIIEWIWHPL